MNRKEYSSGFGNQDITAKNEANKSPKPKLSRFARKAVDTVVFGALATHGAIAQDAKPKPEGLKQPEEIVEVNKDVNKPLTIKELFKLMQKRREEKPPEKMVFNPERPKPLPKLEAPKNPDNPKK